MKIAPRIHIVDDLTPEASAMIQAIYSRSNETIASRYDDVKRKGPDKFMKDYYIGYGGGWGSGVGDGHKSIGDCAITIVSLEAVSIMAAKAIQDTPLYDGQESSTRYIDFGKQPFILPEVLRIPEVEDYTGSLRHLYSSSMLTQQGYLRDKYPRQSDENEKVWEKAIAARAFDVLRSLLPAGATTNLSWQTKFSHARQRLKMLIHHPLEEVRLLAYSIYAMLVNKYPSSFPATICTPEETAYYKENAFDIHYYVNDRSDFTMNAHVYSPNVFPSRWKFDAMVSNRPRKVEMPRAAARDFRYYFDYVLDYASFRDMQRHRPCYNPIPLLRRSPNLDPTKSWYFDEMEPSVREAAAVLFTEGYEKMVTAARDRLFYNKQVSGGSIDRDNFDLDLAVQLQYAIPIGFPVACLLDCDLGEAIYITELRSGKTVHPTARNTAHDMYRIIRHDFPKMPIHADMDPDNWTIRRGSQDIVKVENG